MERKEESRRGEKKGMRGEGERRGAQPLHAFKKGFPFPGQCETGEDSSSCQECIDCYHLAGFLGSSFKQSWSWQEVSYLILY